jgi:hypothetical protein
MSVPDQDPKDWCKVIAIDRRRKVRMDAELRDEKGDLIDINETVEGIVNYVSDKMKSDDQNMIQQQVFPVMARAAVTALSEFVGPQTAGLMISQELFRTSLTSCMMSAFLLMQFIKKNDIKIYTSEQQLSDDELESFDRVNQASSVASLAGQLGANPRDVIREMIKQGRLKQEDLEALGAEDIMDEDVEAGEKN